MLEKYNEKIKELTKTWDGSWKDLEDFLKKLFPKYTFKIKETIEEPYHGTNKYTTLLYADSYVLCSMSWLHNYYIIKEAPLEDYKNNFMEHFIETMNKGIYSREPLMKALQEGKFKGWI